MNHQKHNLIRDFGIIFLSIILAVILIRTNILGSLFTEMKQYSFIASFFAGIFFASAFTAAPAVAAFYEISRLSSVWAMALFGGLGALLADFLILHLIKGHLTEDIRVFLVGNKKELFNIAVRVKFFRWLFLLLGAIVIASPLPDEIGIALLGISKVKMRIFIPLSFTLNFLGILAIGLIAKG